MKDSIEPWLAELYKLAINGNLSINQLYEKFKLEICKIPNVDASEKPALYFYNHEWRWDKERDGAYYLAIDVDDKIEHLQKENEELKVFIKDINSRLNNNESEVRILADLEKLIESKGENK